MTALQLVWFIWGFIKAALANIGYEIAKDLLNLAQQYIREADQHPEWTGEQKRAWVADQLRNNAIATGNVIADSLINLVIEIALQRVKSEGK